MDSKPIVCLLNTFPCRTIEVSFFWIWISIERINGVSMFSPCLRGLHSPKTCSQVNWWLQFAVQYSTHRYLSPWWIGDLPLALWIRSTGFFPLAQIMNWLWNTSHSAFFSSIAQLLFQFGFEQHVLSFSVKQKYFTIHYASLVEVSFLPIHQKLNSKVQ